MTAQDLWTLVRVGVPAPAPDGTFAVVGATRYDLDANKGTERLYRVTPGAEPVALTAAEVSCSQPAVSADGRSLAFVRRPIAKDEKARPQLHVLPLGQSGEARQVGELPLGVVDLRWLPDSNRIIVLAPVYRSAMTVEGTARLRDERAAAKAAPPHVTEDRVYRFWDRWLTDEEVPHLFVVDVTTGELRDLTPDADRWFDLMDPTGQFDVSPDGAEVAFSANATLPPYDRLRYAIWVVRTAGGPTRCLTPTNPADDVRPRYSPDGRWLVYGMKREWDNEADRVRLVRIDRSSNAHEVLTEAWDRSATTWEFADDRTLVVEAEDRARVGLFRLDPAAGPALPRLLARDGSAHLARGAGAGGWVYAQHQSLRHPPEVSRVRVEGGSYERVSRFNDALIAELGLGEAEDVEFAGPDGARVHMLVVLPPEFDRTRKWPLVHLIHGGPHTAHADQWHFRWNPHVVAAPGYVTALVNFHGSSGFGQTFSDCIMGDWGGRPAQDLLLATDHLVAQGFIDPARMAITGGSFGGYLTLWLATQTDRFRCGVAHAAVYDLGGIMGSDVTQGIERELGGEPWGPPEARGAINRSNPAWLAHSIRSPMLILHGEKDFRVPVNEALEAYGVLKARGVPARLVYYPDENHWILKPKSSLHWYGEFLAWLRRWLAE